MPALTIESIFEAAVKILLEEEAVDHHYLQAGIVCDQIPDDEKDRRNTWTSPTTMCFPYSE